MAAAVGFEAGDPVLERAVEAVAESADPEVALAVGLEVALAAEPAADSVAGLDPGFG